MRTLLVLLAACALAAGMVPRVRRGESDNQVCKEQMPCGWIVYEGSTHVILSNITNEYCKCSKGKVCIPTEDEDSSNTFVLYCKPPSWKEDIALFY